MKLEGAEGCSSFPKWRYVLTPRYKLIARYQVDYCCEYEGRSMRTNE